MLCPGRNAVAASSRRYCLTSHLRLCWSNLGLWLSEPHLLSQLLCDNTAKCLLHQHPLRLYRPRLINCDGGTATLRFTCCCTAEPPTRTPNHLRYRVSPAFCLLPPSTPDPGLDRNFHGLLGLFLLTLPLALRFSSRYRKCYFQASLSTL